MTTLILILLVLMFPAYFIFPVILGAALLRIFWPFAVVFGVLGSMVWVAAALLG